MSTKTLRKRIALVVAATLGAGALSVVTASVANASGPVIAGASNITLATSTAGVCVGDSGTTDITVVNYPVFGSQNITVAVDNSSDNIQNSESVIFTLTGPAVWTTAASADLDAGSTTLPLVVSADAKTITITAASNGATSDVIPDPTFRLTGTGAVEAKVFSGTSTTLRDTLKVFSVAACDNDSYSATTSKSRLHGTSETALNASSALTATDEAGANVQTYSSTAYIALWLADKYGTSITSTGRYLTASATNGAIVSWTPGTSTSYLPTAVVTSNLHNEVLGVKLPSTVTSPTNTTVTIALDGATIATRTITFTGQPAKIVVTGVATHIAASGTDVFNWVVQDSAGNQLGSITAEAGSSTANVNGASVTNVATTSSATAVATATITAGAAEGESATTLRVKLDDGTYVVSDSLKFFTSTASIATFTASTDKAVYAPGEVVTLTVTAKNAKGNPVADSTVLGGTVTWTPSGLTNVVAAPAAADKPTSGVFTYKFYASTTEGNYGWAFGTSSASVTTTPITGTFQVKSSSVTNAEVLASIVKLIASINKQIRALQKLIRR